MSGHRRNRHPILGTADESVAHVVFQSHDHPHSVDLQPDGLHGTPSIPGFDALPGNLDQSTTSPPQVPLSDEQIALVSQSDQSYPASQQTAYSAPQMTLAGGESTLTYQEDQFHAISSHTAHSAHGTTPPEEIFTIAFDRDQPRADIEQITPSTFPINYSQEISIHTFHTDQSHTVFEQAAPFAPRSYHCEERFAQRDHINAVVKQTAPCQPGMNCSDVPSAQKDLSHAIFGPAAPFATRTDHLNQTSALQLRRGQAHSIMNLLTTETQLNNHYFDRLPTGALTRQLHDQNRAGEERSIEVPIYEIARSHCTESSSIHRRTSQSSLTFLADLEYQPPSQYSRYMHEELYEPRALEGSLPDYSRVHKMILLRPEHSPPSDIFSERSSILDSEDGDASSYAELFHRDGCLPQPTRLSDLQTQESASSNDHTYDQVLSRDRPTSCFGMTPERLACVQQWILHVLPPDTDEESEAEVRNNDSEMAQTEDDTESSFMDGNRGAWPRGDQMGASLMEHDPFIIAPAASRPEIFTSSRNGMDTEYLALTSAQNNFLPYRRQSQAPSTDVRDSKTEHIAEALACLTRKRTPNTQIEVPGTSFSAGLADEKNGPEQALERLQGRSRTQVQVQLQEANIDPHELAPLTNSQHQRGQSLEVQPESDNFVENCKDFIVYQLGSVEAIPRHYCYRFGGSEQVRRRLQEHFGDERIGYAWEVFQQIMERRNPSVSIDEDDIWASWRHDYAHRMVGPPVVLFIASMWLWLTRCNRMTSLTPPPPQACSLHLTPIESRLATASAMSQSTRHPPLANPRRRRRLPEFSLTFLAIRSAHYRHLHQLQASPTTALRLERSRRG